MGKFTVNRGTTFTIGLVYKKNNVPASLVGATIRFTIKNVEFDTNPTDTTAIVKKDVVTHTDPANGVSTIALTPTDTATITPGKYRYDIKVAEPGGVIYKIDEGVVTIDGSPTNRLT